MTDAITSTWQDFADGRYKFWLPINQAVALEREIGHQTSDGQRPGSVLGLFHQLGENLAPAAVGEAVLVGATSARITECQAVIRRGLMGGGMGQVDGETIAVHEETARHLVGTHCFPARPAILDMALAWRILRAVVYGEPQEPVAEQGSGELAA